MNLAIIEAIPLLLRAIRLAVESNPDFKVCYHAPHFQSLEHKILALQPDVLWLDATLPEVQDGSAVQTIHKQLPDVKILLYGTGESVPEIRKYFKQGVSAYLPKSADAEEILTALESMKSGERYLPESVNKALASWITHTPRKKKPACKLTEREQEVLQLIVEEFTTGEIAKKLFIGQCTVETHRIKLIQKLGVKNVAGLVREAVQQQLYVS